ncbi:MAG: hypothetical protein Q9M35_01015 [Rhodothermus sp.]|nr:hypothetical protein [Rhodothermus sp.]
MWSEITQRFPLLQNLFSRPVGGDGRRPDGGPSKGTVITICILISTLLWFTFTLQETYTTTLDLPVRVVNLPPDQALAVPPPSVVRVQLRGEGYPLVQLYFNPPTVTLDARQDAIDLTGVDLNLPRGVVVEGVVPQVVELRKEPRVTRRLPVDLRVTIETAPTHDLLVPPRVDPDSVLVSGAVSIVEGLPAWPTVAMHLRDVRDSIALRIPLSDTLQPLVTVRPDAVWLRARVAPFTEGVRELPVRVTGVPSNERMVTLEPATVRVRFRVPLSQYETAMVAPDFFATVPYEVIRADTTGRVRPLIHLPEGLLIRDVVVIPPALRYYNVLIQ